jgi:hypothetical protein
MPTPPHRFEKGHQKWGGRPPGGKNRATLARERLEGKSLAIAIEKLGVPPATLENLTPIGIMKFVMVERFRAGDHNGALAAAQSVAPYVHPKLAMTDMRVTSTTAAKTSEELLAEREELVRKLAAAEPIEGSAVELNTDSLEPAQLEQEPEPEQSLEQEDLDQLDPTQQNLEQDLHQLDLTQLDQEEPLE